MTTRPLHIAGRGDHPSAAGNGAPEPTLAALADRIGQLEAAVRENSADVAYATELMAALYHGFAELAARFGRRLGVRLPPVRPRPPRS